MLGRTIIAVDGTLYGMRAQLNSTNASRLGMNGILKANWPALLYRKREINLLTKLGQLRTVGFFSLGEEDINLIENLQNFN